MKLIVSNDNLLLLESISPEARLERPHDRLPGQRANEQVGQQALAAHEEAQDGGLQRRRGVRVHLRRA